MMNLPKTFIALGILFIAIGILLQVFGKISWIGKLPGDLLIKKENFTVYFPLTTCVLISIILSLIFFLWNQK